ncbi:hypothetical protein ACNKHR_07970 [Shigella flexneri]
MRSATAKGCRSAASPQHIEQAGEHSGDSACPLPAYTRSQRNSGRDAPAGAETGLRTAGARPDERAVCGEKQRVYPIEVNPRAARTVPFVSKATGVPLARVAARVMAADRWLSRA